MKGRSIIEILWEELDAIVDRLHADGEPAKNPGRLDTRFEADEALLSDLLDDWKAWGEERGKAQGVAYALAVMINPYEPNIEAIRQRSIERRKEREK